MIKININDEEIKINGEAIEVDGEERVVIRKNRSGMRAKIVSATPLISLFVFLILGCCFDMWHPGWIVFLAIPIVPVILYSFGNGFKKNFNSILSLVISLGYLIVGICFGIWHPTWIAFLLIPICAIFIDE